MYKIGDEVCHFLSNCKRAQFCKVILPLKKTSELNTGHLSYEFCVWYQCIVNKSYEIQ